MLEGGGEGLGNQRGGIGEVTKKEGWLEVKFNTYRGVALLFSLFFTNWKSGRRAIRVQIFILAYTGIIQGKYQLQVC